MRDRLIELIDGSGDKVLSIPYIGSDGAAALADHLLAEGVIVLPCKVGSTIYRIDTIEFQCTHEGSFYDEYYCGGCRHLMNGDCDARKKPYIYEIKNANAQTILGNEHLIGTRAFLTREEAERALKGAEK